MSIMSRLRKVLLDRQGSTTAIVFSSASRQRREIIAKDTLENVDSVVASMPGASLDSEFVREEDMPPLTRDDVAVPWPNYSSSQVKVINSDSFAVSVLNLASDSRPGGGWRFTLSCTQEEALCYSSTLYPTLKDAYYPWKNSGTGSAMGIYSPAIVVFKDDLMHDCTYLPESERILVSVLTFAAPRRPKLTPDGLRFANHIDVDVVQAKVQVLLRTAARHGQDTLVLGAMGCGAYGCPPGHIAEIMCATLKTEEFRGWFRRVDFAVFSRKEPNFIGADNFDIFNDVFRNVRI
ncbi:hypothetical protein BKA62DRAFT_721484 [Auriculariales sp. MPI-PUGE-AT-0066]|nr:hypothetical protein BKA62DRAFT_721484 [Auriculariales sp. MPI-PUGE-AT-0066]